MRDALARFHRDVHTPERELALLLLVAVPLTWWATLYLARASINMAFIATGGLAAAALAWFGGLRLALPLYFGTLLMTEVRLPGLPLSLNRGMAGLLVLAFAVDLLRERARPAFSIVLPLYFLFHLYVLVGALATRPEEAGYPIQIAFYQLPFLAILLYFFDRARMSLLLWGFLLAATVAVFLPGALELATGLDLRSDRIEVIPGFRINGLAVNAIVFGATAVWSFLLALFLWLAAPDTRLKALALGLAVGFAALAVLTQNRQTPVIMAAAFLVFLLLMRSPWKALYIGGSFSGGVVLLPAVVYLLWDRITQASSLLNDISLMERYDKILVAREMWRDHFWFGVGHDHFGYLWQDYKPKGDLVWIYDDWTRKWIDSGYVQIFTEYGAVGTGLLLLLFGAALVLYIYLYSQSWRLRSPWLTNYLAFVAALFGQFLVQNLVSDAVMAPQIFIQFALLFGAVALLRAEREREASERPPE